MIHKSSQSFYDPPPTMYLQISILWCPLPEGFSGIILFSSLLGLLCSDWKLPTGELSSSLGFNFPSFSFLLGVNTPIPLSSVIVTVTWFLKGLPFPFLLLPQSSMHALLISLLSLLQLSPSIYFSSMLDRTHAH